MVAAGRLRPMTSYENIEVAIEAQVATIRILPPSRVPIESGANLHWELGTVMSQLRAENAVRVVVLTGVDDQFLVVRPPESYRTEGGRRGRTDPTHIWHTFTGITRMHEQMVQMEKPIIARVNGDAIGFGSSLVFACDLIVAREDARIIDTHMAMGEVAGVGPADFALVPGDGGTALVPMFMSPALAKEYLMLSRSFSAAELARLGIINYAVPAGELDGKVNELTTRLLRRSAYALAWTKRAANRLVADQLARALDAGAGYEMANFMQWERMNWGDTKELGG